MLKEMNQVPFTYDRNEAVFEFLDCVHELLNDPEVKRLTEFKQHMNTSRWQHSLNVAFCSFLICKKMNLDFRSAARAGLLHDLFLYDWRCERQPEGNHAFAHPIVALRNASRITELNRIEQDAIVRHMWPVTWTLPAYKESYVVSFADKFCACYEVYSSCSTKLFRAASYLKSIYDGGILAR